MSKVSTHWVSELSSQSTPSHSPVLVVFSQDKAATVQRAKCRRAVHHGACPTLTAKACEHICTTDDSQGSAVLRLGARERQDRRKDIQRAVATAVTVCTMQICLEWLLPVGLLLMVLKSKLGCFLCQRYSGNLLCTPSLNRTLLYEPLETVYVPFGSQVRSHEDREREMPKNGTESCKIQKVRNLKQTGYTRS